MYSVEQVAALLGLHERTVRGYIRAGRLQAVRIGKQYRIARAALEAFTGRSEPVGGTSAEVSSIVQVDGVDRSAADRLSALALGAVGGDCGTSRSLRVHTVYDEVRTRLKVVVLGAPGETAKLLRLLDSVLEGGLHEARA